VTTQELKAAHRHCSRNRDELSRSTNAGCFFCLRIYPATDIEEWTDDGMTAICAHCPTDSVIGDGGWPLSAAFLREMCEYWFSATVVSEYGVSDATPAPCCPILASALEFRPELLVQRSNGRIVIPVHDGEPQEGCRGRSGMEVSFCPWSGHPLRPVDRSSSATTTVPHACEVMTIAIQGEDLIVAFDAPRSRYLLPVFDGAPDENCLGSDGIEILFCPWCGVTLSGEAILPGGNLESYRTKLPFGTKSPRF
jgi:hypothetical protein